MQQKLKIIIFFIICLFFMDYGLWTMDYLGFAQNETVKNETMVEQSVADGKVQNQPEVQQEPADQPEAKQEVVPESKKEEVSDKIAGGMKGFVSLDLRDIDIVDAIKFLSSKAGLDIITTQAVSGKISLMVENVLVKDVFDIMLRSNKLAYDKTGDIYNVMTETEYKGLYGKPFSDVREVATFRLKYTIPDQAFSLFDTLKSEVGRILVEPESGNVLIIDVPDKIKEMRWVLDAFEQKNEVKILPLQYAKAKDIEDQLKSQLDYKKVGLIKADERANQVMVQSLPGRMKDIERIIKELDVKTKEVIVDISIVKIKFTDENTKGVEWEGLFDLVKKKGLFYMGSTPFATVNPSTTAGQFASREETLKTENGYVGSYPFSGTTSVLSSSVPAVGTEKIHVGLVAAQDADVLLKYIQALGSTKIIANPKLVVTNNQESRIHVGEKQAYVTTTTTSGSSTNTVAENVTFVDVGTQISLTPTINNDGYVTMKVKTEVSSVSSTLTTPTQNKIPIIDSSLAETTVMVKEGTTIVIGGLRKEERSTSSKQTPFLSRIPLIGEIFKSGTNKIDRTELVIMLTPRIITGDVFISDSGKRVEQVGIKDRKEYKTLRPVFKEAEVLGNVDNVVVASSGQQSLPSVDDKKIVIKGLRVVE